MNATTFLVQCLNAVQYGLLLFLVAHMVVLSWADFSYVQPASASGYVLTPLLGVLVAGEHIHRLQWGGVLLICLGVGLIGRTPVRTSSAQ